MNTWVRSGVAATGLLAATIGGMASCTSRDAGSSSSSEPTAVVAVADAPLALRQKVHEAQTSTAIIGELHSQGMREIGGMTRQRRSRAEQCVVLARVVRKYSERAHAELRSTRSPAGREAMLRALMRSQNNCEMPLTQSLFLPGTGVTMTGAVTGEYLAHTNALNAALQQTNGSPAAFSPIVEAALVNASSLPQDDLNVVAAVASVAMASAYDWQAISNGAMPPPAMQSLFRFQWQSIALADIGGCILGMIVAEASSWGDLASACALGAFSASFGKFYL